MDPADALDAIAEILETNREPTYRVRAFRNAAKTVRAASADEIEALVSAGKITDLPGIGDKTALVIRQAVEGQTPDYLLRLEERQPKQAEGPGAALRVLLKGDLHLHSDWSDGGSPIKQMAETAIALGHEYMALTDHSPRLTVANGLSPERLREQLRVLDELNAELAPFRILRGIEVDILDDGALDQDPKLLAELDVVVASVHSKLRMDAPEMTKRMVAALANPHVDILGHCTGRLVVGKGRPESTFDEEIVVAAAHRFDKAIEINSRPERLDPPRRILRLMVDSGVKTSVDSDAHAPGQLHWQPYGCDRAVEENVDPDLVVNTWSADDLLAWTASHAAS
ncbi:MAG TPA: PHP domain-containing protein [Acidimicrobiales bacterium]|nr:PHP domain-containing protein [Acidimicrobiales bacterium]